MQMLDMQTLVHRLRRWTNVKPTVIQRLVSACTGYDRTGVHGARPLTDAVRSGYVGNALHLAKLAAERELPQQTRDVESMLV